PPHHCPPGLWHHRLRSAVHPGPDGSDYQHRHHQRDPDLVLGHFLLRGNAGQGLLWRVPRQYLILFLATFRYSWGIVQRIPHRYLSRSILAFCIAIATALNSPTLLAKAKEKKTAESATQQLSRLVLTGQFREALDFLKGFSDKNDKGAWRLRLKFLAA